MKKLIKTLKNGMNIIAVHNPGLQSVGIAACVKFGSIDENPKINGSAHYLEHMLFKGTKKRTWKDIGNKTREFGIYSNAMTDFETTTYMMQCYKTDLEKTMDLLSDQIKNSILPKKEFNLERGAIINENLMRLDNPGYFLYDVLPRTIFKKHPARMPISGDNDNTVKKIKRNDLLKIFKEDYAPKNMALAIFGGSSVDNSLNIASKYFSDFNKTYAPKKRIIANEKQSKTKLVIKKPGLNNTIIGIGLKCNEFEISDLQEYAGLKIITQVLSNNLYDEIREKRGFYYYSRADLNSYSTFGFISLISNSKPENKNDVINIMLDELEKIEKQKINKDDVKKVKRQIIVNNMMLNEQSLYSAIQLSTNKFLRGGNPFISEKIMNSVKSIKLDEIKKYSSKYINTDSYGLAIVEPK